MKQRSWEIPIATILLAFSMVYMVVSRTPKPVAAASTTVYVVRSGTVTWGPVTIQPGDWYWFTIPASGVTTSMRVALYTPQDMTTIPGFVPSTNNGTVIIYPPYVSPAGTINVKFVNLTANPIKFGPLTLGWSAYNQ